MPTIEAWAIHHRDYGWLIDSCAGGKWSDTPAPDMPDEQVYELAVTFDTGAAAYAALDAADIPREGCEARRLLVRVLPSSSR